MRARALGTIFLLALLGLAMTACMQFGEYAMGGACEGLSQEVASAVRSAYAIDPDISGLWAGEDEVWCRFTVGVDSDVDATNEVRMSLRREVERLLHAASPGIEVTLLYANDSDPVAVQR